MPITITYVSTRCDGEITSDRSEFPDIPAAQGYVRETFRTTPGYWRVFLYDCGARVMMGTRSDTRAGRHTGQRWVWDDMIPARASVPGDAAYDTMTRAWREGDYAQAWERADTIIRFTALGYPEPSQPSAMYYVGRLHAHYAPPRSEPADV